MREQTIWVCAVLIAAAAGILDWRTRKIPNWLTMPAFLAGLGANLAAGGFSGGVRSLEGTGVALAILLPLVLMRGLGGGDWKLMIALGSWLGPGRILVIILGTVLLSGLLALIQIIRKRRFLTTIRNLWELLRGFFIFGFLPHPEINLDSPNALTIPFGVAAGFATLLCFWMGWGIR